MSLHMMIPLSLEGIILLCAVLLCCCGSELVRAESESGLQNITLFKGTTQPSGAEEGEVYFFTGQSFIEVNGMLMAIANAHYQPGSVDEVGNGPTDDSVWVKYFRYKGTGSAEWVSKITEADGSGWKMELAVARKNAELCTSMLHGLQVVVRDERIFMLLLRENKSKEKKENGKQDCGDDWDLELNVGNVSQTTTETNVISWGSPISLKSTFTEHHQKKSWTMLSARNGRGVLMDGSTIVFPFMGVHNNEEYSEACTVVYSKDGGSSWKFPTQGAIAEGCESQRPFVWEGKLYMIVKHGYFNHTAHQSTDGGETWARVSGNQPTVLNDDIVNFIGEAHDIITANIAERNVILFTMPQGYLAPFGYSTIFLWMTDNHRVHPVGPISHDPAVETSFASLLYTNDKLFSLHDLGKVADGRVILTHLAEQLDQVKSVLKTWKDVDERISPPSLTNGLVGFLSNKGNTTKWEDEYLGVGATVQGSATKVDNGLKLTLPGTQVVWPIGEQGGNQVYSFTNRGFTVVVTVTIHNKPQSVTRLMGIVLFMNPSDNYVGLSFDKDRQWKGVTVDEGSGKPNTWEEGKTYQVALAFKDGTGSVYIDGKLLGSLEDPVGGAAPNAKSVTSQARAGEFIMLRGILRVYLGEQNESNQGSINSEVTVRSVMLYNRPLSTAELEMLISDNTNSGKYSDGRVSGRKNGDARVSGSKNGDARVSGSKNGDARVSSSKNGDARVSGSKNGDARASSSKNGDARVSGRKNGDALKAIREDSSMCQRVSCLLLVFMGFLGFASLF